MIIRMIMVLFVSAASGVCYLSGLTRLMSSLLVAFGSLVSIFFGVLFVIPEGNRELWFPVYGKGAAWPFFLLAVTLAIIAGLLVTGRREFPKEEQVAAIHFKCFGGAIFVYLLSVFISAFFWFPSDARRLATDEYTLGVSVFIGTCLYLVGTVIALLLFYRASKGTAAKYPDLMRRLVLAVFSVVHLDKLPAFIAFLLIYSPETQIIYPSSAALALAAYVPVSLFLLKLSWQSERTDQIDGASL